MNNFDGLVLPLPSKRKALLLPLLPLCMTLCLAPRPVSAVEVYQWTDDNGVVHFSQMPPTEPEKDVSTLNVDGNPPAGYDPEADIYNVEANQKSMESLWSDLDARREAGNNQPAAEPQVMQQTSYPEYGGVWPYFPGSGTRPPNRPDRPVRPETPEQLPSHSFAPRKRNR